MSEIINSQVRHLKPLISVIVPVYNMRLYLDKCITSIMNQTYDNLEIILVDDGSTDGSSEVCDHYASIDERIRVIHKLNGGLSSARNAGLDVCSGDYVGFVDSDDWIASNMYEILLSNCMDIRTIATISMAEVDSNGDVVGGITFQERIAHRDEVVRNILCHFDSGSVCSRLFPRVVIGSARFDEKKLNEDVLFFVSLLDNFDYVSYVSSIGYFYYRREGSISRHFGKAVHDMVGNSRWIRSQIEDRIPSLAAEAERFEINQHMSFLFCCPFDYDRENDPLFAQVVRYLRAHLCDGLNNKCFTRKEKVKLICVTLLPRLMSLIVEMKG